jgi:hypothetical protein
MMACAKGWPPWTCTCNWPGRKPAASS